MPSKRSAHREDAENEVDLKTLLPRRLTMPKRVSASDGAEVAWAAVLKAQAKILGAEHPLIWSSKHAMSLSRVQHHQECRPSLLVSLRDSEAIAVQTLGKVHPLVEAFSSNLKVLERLIRSPLALEDSHASKTDSIEDTVSPVSPLAAYNEVPLPDNNHTLKEGDAYSDAHSPSRPLPTITTSFIADKDEVVLERERPSVDANSLWDSCQPPHTPKSEVSLLCGMVFSVAMATLKNGLSWLERTYGPEPAVQPGRVRVRWTCSCGSQLYDDFVERRLGAARELEAYLNRPSTRTGGTPTSPASSASRSYSGSFNSSISGTASSNTSWSNYSQASHSSLNEKQQPSRTKATLSQYSPFVPIAEPPWLLVCSDEDRFTPKITHVDVAQHKITSDKDLAKTLREHYFEVNRKWWKRFRLRGLTTIEFVQFECHQNRFADIRKCPDMPPVGQGDYTFEPSELIPPVGNAYLKHLFHHPEDYDGELITYLRAPKKNGRLQLGVGWGIHLVEGFLAEKVWLYVNVLFVATSLVFGIAWTCERNDIQGAFGVAQWICMLAVFVGGWLQACFG